VENVVGAYLHELDAPFVHVAHADEIQYASVELRSHANVHVFCTGFDGRLPIILGFPLE